MEYQLEVSDSKNYAEKEKKKHISYISLVCIFTKEDGNFNVQHV